MATLLPGHVRKRGGDTLTLVFNQGQLNGLGPFTFRLDSRGRLVWLTGNGSTVQVDVTVFPVLAVVAGVLLGISALAIVPAGRYWKSRTKYDAAAAGPADDLA